MTCPVPPDAPHRDDFVQISASQIKTWVECPSKLLFDKVDGLPRAEGPAAALGTKVHAEIERYYETGQAPDGEETAPISLAIMQHLPPRGRTVSEPDGAESVFVLDETLQVENEVHFFWPGPNVFVKGYVDLRRLELPTPEVYDHKSTSSINKYAKTEEDLLTDPQALIYGMGIRLDCKEKFGVVPDEVDLQWTYGETKTPKTRLPKSKPVRVRQSLRVLEEGFAAMEPIAREIADHVSRGVKGGEVDGRSDSCWKYGPCHYRDSCPTYARVHRKTQPPKERMPIDSNLLASLAAMSDEPMAEAPTEPETPTGTGVAPLVQASAGVTAEPTLAHIDASAATATSAVNPPDAAPDVSPSDPLPPPKKPSRARGAKALRESVVSSASPTLALFGVSSELNPMVSTATQPNPPPAEEFQATVHLPKHIESCADLEDTCEGVIVGLKTLMTRAIERSNFTEARDLLDALECVSSIAEDM